MSERRSSSAGPLSVFRDLAWLLPGSHPEVSDIAEDAVAVPSWERKGSDVWLTAVFYGRDIFSLTSVDHPREPFVARE
jgi:hypothetical protein